MLNKKIIGKCSKCNGNVTIPSGPIGYVGPIENLIRCEKCGASKDVGRELPIIKMK